MIVIHIWVLCIRYLNIGIGVNTMILEDLKEWSYAKGLEEIRSDVYCDNQSAIRAYEKAGFKRHMVGMRLG
ncbi:MAG: hypothetical protein CR994_00335 [Maribacter sp.]|nr:MAG: hypothetical protein CR994_00335 [Maribacter sp.]